jgi:hypothetical protein
MRPSEEHFAPASGTRHLVIGLQIMVAGRLKWWAAGNSTGDLDAENWGKIVNAVFMQNLCSTRIDTPSDAATQTGFATIIRSWDVPND